MMLRKNSQKPIRDSSIVFCENQTANQATANDTVTVNYRGWLDDDTEFDSSYERGEPISFPLRGVIPGWTEGMQLVGVGGMIELTIPAELGYQPVEKLILAASGRNPSARRRQISTYLRICLRFGSLI